MTRKMTPDQAREINWEDWAEMAVNAGYELVQPSPSEDGSWPISVTAGGRPDRFILARRGLPEALVTGAPDHLVIRPWRAVTFTR